MTPTEVLMVLFDLAKIVAGLAVSVGLALLALPALQERLVA